VTSPPGDRLQETSPLSVMRTSTGRRLATTTNSCDPVISLTLCFCAQVSRAVTGTQGAGRHHRCEGVVAVLRPSGVPHLYDAAGGEDCGTWQVCPATRRHRHGRWVVTGGWMPWGPGEWAPSTRRRTPRGGPWP